MAVIKELLRSEADGSISFGNHELAAKSKVEDFAFQGDIYKVKTFGEITRLEKNDRFLYESVPGTSVSHFTETPDTVTFAAEGADSAQITLELEDGASYDVTVDGKDAGVMTTSMGGKINLNVEFAGQPVAVEIRKK